MRVKVDCDERFPDFRFVEASQYSYFGKVFELDDAEYQDYMRVKAEYEAWQARLKGMSLWKKAGYPTAMAAGPAEGSVPTAGSRGRPTG